MGATDGFLPAGKAESWEGFAEDDTTSIQVVFSGSTVEVKYFVSLTSDDSGRFRKMDMFYKAQEMLLELLICYTISGFFYHMEAWNNRDLLPLCGIVLL